MSEIEQLIESVVRRVLGERKDTVTHIEPGELAARYRISKRTAGEWIRQMIGQGVLRKRGRFPMGKLSDCDAWVAQDEPKRRRRGVTLSLRMAASDGES